MYTIGAENEQITDELVLLVMRILELKAAFDESMWLVSELDTMHMTRYEKFFTTLDRTHKGKVEFEDESFAMVEGIGDVKITMKEGKTKTIKNVLFVPHGIKRNVLGLSQMESKGYLISEGEEGERLIRDRTGAEFGKSIRSKGDSLLYLRVIEGNLTS